MAALTNRFIGAVLWTIAYTLVFIIIKVFLIAVSLAATLILRTARERRGRR